MDVVARGQLNFNDLEATPDDIWDYISPRQQTTSVSELWQVQGTLAKDLFELPGGPLQAAVGVLYRDESIDAPSANRSEEHTSELQSLMRISDVVFCFKKKK